MKNLATGMARYTRSDDEGLTNAMITAMNATSGISTD